MAASENKPWAVFKVVDATGAEFLNTGSHPDYEPAFRKHVAAWKQWVKTKEYQSKVSPYRWPVMPCRVVIEACE